MVEPGKMYRDFAFLLDHLIKHSEHSGGTDIILGAQRDIMPMVINSAHLYLSPQVQVFRLSKKAEFMTVMGVGSILPRMNNDG